MENKEFKTITLRDLDNSPDLVRIMNEVARDKGEKTGQKIIEVIIRGYLIQKNRISELEKERNQLYCDNHKIQMEMTEKLNKRYTVISNLRTALKGLNEIEL